MMCYRMLIVSILILKRVLANNNGDNIWKHEKPPTTRAMKKKCLTLFQNFKYDQHIGSIYEMKHSDTPPDLGKATNIPRGVPFCTFNSDHMDAVVDLIKYFRKAETPEELFALGENIKHLVNQRLYTFVLYHVIGVKRFDIDVPAYTEVYPEDFTPAPIMKAITRRKEIVARQEGMSRVESHRLPSGEYRVSVRADLGGQDSDIERRVAYFREDYGINEHHTNWHIVHLFLPRANVTDWPEAARKGEYFAYAHQQVIARYNMERLSVNIPRVISYDDPINSTITEAYYPNLGLESDSKARRRANMRTRIDMTNNTQLMQFQDLNTAKNQIDFMFDAKRIDDAQFLFELENYHNHGHMIIAEIKIEEDQNKPGVMSETATALRDPVFFRWHKHIDNLSDQYLDMRRLVHNERLSYDYLSDGDFEVTGLEVLSRRDGRRRNELVTGCNFHSIEATNGLDLMGNDTTYIEMTHLDHIPFDYHIKVNNRDPRRMDKRGLVRIFLGPKYDEYGREFDYESQRRIWAEMDKFFYNFKPGENRINRQSLESTVAVNCRNSFRDITERINDDGPSVGFCGCGWPQHMLLPRGNETGMAFLLFVMITSEPDNPDLYLGRSTHCGDPNESYDNDPDPRPMGYPFHEIAPPNTKSIHDFDRKLMNAYVIDITIRFSGEQINRNKPSVNGCRNPRMSSKTTGYSSIHKTHSYS